MNPTEPPQRHSDHGKIADLVAKGDLHIGGNVAFVFHGANLGNELPNNVQQPRARDRTIGIGGSLTGFIDQTHFEQFGSSPRSM